MTAMYGPSTAGSDGAGRTVPSSTWLGLVDVRQVYSLPEARPKAYGLIIYILGPRRSRGPGTYVIGTNVPKTEVPLGTVRYRP